MDSIAEPARDADDGQPEWPERPRPLTLRGLAIALLILVFATAMALAVLHARQMDSEKTSAFLGEETAEAIRVGRPVELQRPVGSEASADLDRYHQGWIDLTELRDIGYFRRVFLDDNNYQWSRLETAHWDTDQPPWQHIRFGAEPPTKQGVTINFHPFEGWVLTEGGDSAVMLSDHMRKRLKYRLDLIAKLPAQPAID